MPHRRLAICGWLFLCLVVCGGRSALSEQTVVVVLDDSGSMNRSMRNGEQRMVAAKTALASVLQKLMRDTQVGVMALNSQVGGSSWILPIGSPDPHRWQHTLEQVRAVGGTPLGERMRQASDALLSLRAKRPYDEYRLLVVTDGEATDAPLLESILPDLMSRGIRMDVIGVDMQEQHSLARLAHSYRSANDSATLTAALSQVFAETAVDGQSSQADFDLLAGLPDDVAGAIVKQMSLPRNDPLLTVAENPGNSDPSEPYPGYSTAPPSSSTVSSSPQAKSPGFFPSCFEMFALLVVIMAVMSLLRGLRGKPSRRR